MLAGRGRHYGGNNGHDKLSYPMYQDIRDKNQVFNGMFCTHTRHHERHPLRAAPS